MQPAIQREPPPPTDFLIELPAHSRLPRLDLGIEWESPWREFWTSAHDCFAGPRPGKEDGFPRDRVLRVDWIRGRLPGRAFVASCLWHVAAVGILLLPIWSFLPKSASDLAPVQIELTWYGQPQDLPPISLPANAAKRHPARDKPDRPPKAEDDPSKPLVERGADAINPRQTILSVPVRVTHPRQTLIQPDAPAAPPKIEPQLPNIVEWAAPQPKVQLRLAPSASAPRIERRAVRDVAVPEIANSEKNPGPLNIASTPELNSQPRMPVSPVSAPVVKRDRRQAEAAAAPEVSPAASAGDASLHRLIALSATPAPPAPEVSVPQGNLAARISISSEGARTGAPGGEAHGTAETGTGSRGNAGASATGAANNTGSSGGGNANSLPAAVSISGGIAPAGSHPGKLILTPMAPVTASRRGPSVAGAIDPSLPPEKILSGKEVYTIYMNMPNLTSVSGSWILNFAQLDEGDVPPYRRKGQLSGPVPLEAADPKYPPAFVKAHIQGEVVLYAIIRKDGSVDSIQVVRGVEPQLDRNAMEALARWKFRAGARDGAPVDLEAVVHISFRYRDP